MKRKTTITLTIAGFLAIAGIFYAAPNNPYTPNTYIAPDPFSAVPLGLGVAAAPDLLLVSSYCNQNLYTVACDGTFSVLTQIPLSPPILQDCKEKYEAIVPLKSANLASPPWTARDIFITQGADVFRFTGGVLIPTPFVTIAGCAEADHSGITFDHVGTFDYNMIVSCEDGSVWEIDANANIVGGGDIGNTHTQAEGPGVAPLSFGFYAGWCLVADESGNGWVHAIKRDGTVALNVFHVPGAESIQVIPDNPCTFCSGHAFFQALPFGNGGPNPATIYGYLPIDFAGLGGSILVPSETGAGTWLIQSTGPGPNDYSVTGFDLITFQVMEGGSFVDCDVPSPTPTPTATATATFTPTATATFTPTATATFTPTATATSTPTATATSTPTPTPTPPGVGFTQSTSIQANFNNFAIAPNNFLWFSSVLKADHLPTNAPVTVTFTNQTITIPGFGTVTVPNSTVTFNPAAGSASTTFGGTWTTTVPSNIKGNTFFSGDSVQIPAGLPGSSQTHLEWYDQCRHARSECELAMGCG